MTAAPPRAGYVRNRVHRPTPPTRPTTKAVTAPRIFMRVIAGFGPLLVLVAVVTYLFA